MRRFVHLVIISLVILIELSGCQKTISSSTDSGLLTYSDTSFHFSVDYPSEWTSRVDAKRVGTDKIEGSPDGGINLFISGNQDNRVFVFGQVSSISNPEDPGMKKEKFTTDSGLIGNMYISESNGKTELHLIFNEQMIKPRRSLLN